MITNKFNYDLSNLNLPNVCPVCGSDLEVLENGKVRCVNKSCEQKVAHKILTFFDKLDIKGAGPAFVNNASKDCKSLFDFLSSLTKSNVDAVKWAGGINGEKITDKVNKVLKKEIDIPTFLSCLDIEGVADGQIKKVLKANPKADLEFFIHPKNSGQFLCEGIKDKLATTIYEGILDSKEEIENCLPFFNIGKTEEKPTGGKLSGLSFCFTGAACKPRKELEKMVTDNGGEVTSVKKGLSYLVTDDTESGSAKNEKAKKLGIPVITSLAFLDLCK